MLLPFITIQYFLLFQQSLGSKLMQITVIENYIKWQNTTNTVNAFICWEKNDMQKLTETLNDKSVMFNAQNNIFSIAHLTKVFSNIFIVDLDCNNSNDLLIMANQSLLFRPPNHWLLLSKADKFGNISEERQYFQNFDMFIDSKVILAKEINDEEYNFRYIYKIDKKTNIIFDNFALWKDGNKFLYYEKHSLSWRRRNIRKHALRTSMVILFNDTHNHMDDYRMNEIDATTKINYPLTHSLADYMNASLKIIYVPQWYRNTPDQNNTLLGTILMKEIDISGSPFFCMLERISWLDCIAMTTPIKGFFMFRQPPLSYVKNIFILPFGTNLWLTDISFLILSAILLYIVIVWEWEKIKETQEEPESDMINKSFSESLLFIVGAVTQQGYVSEPKGGPGKILILTIFLTLIFLFTAYTAYTVVLFQATANDIKTLEDLYHSKIVLGLEDKPYYLYYIPKYTEPLRRKIYYEKIAPKGKKPNIFELDDGMKRMRNDYFAFHTDNIAGYKRIHDTFLENEKCGIQEITLMYESYPWIVSPKNSSFLEIFKIGYRKLQDSGLVQRELKKRISHKPECMVRGNSFRSAGILDLYSVYMLLVIGIVSSFVMMFIEILVHKYVHKKHLH